MIAQYMTARNPDALEHAGNIRRQPPIGLVVPIADTVTQVDDNIGIPFVRKIDKLIQQTESRRANFRF